MNTNQTATEANWIEEIKRVITGVEAKHERALGAFAATVEKTGLVSAIEWRGSDVAAAEAEKWELSWLNDFLTNNKMDTEEIARMVSKEIDSRQTQMMNCFRVAASTSAFANAIENAKLEAKFKMFDTFGGTYHVILTIVSRREQK